MSKISSEIVIATLAINGYDNISIVQDNRRLIAMCKKCHAFIHWRDRGDGRYWICSDENHGVSYKRTDEQNKSVGGSVWYFDSDTTDVRDWVAYWLDEDPKNVQVDIVRVE